MKVQASFTLLELVVVIAILFLLAGLLITVGNNAAERGRQTVCLNNLHQLALAFQFYSDDHGKLPLNGFIQRDGDTNRPYWVQGYLNHGASPDATNITLLIDRRFASFADYIHSADTYRCPSDRKRFLTFGKLNPKVRSYSLNGFLGWNFDRGMAPGRVSLKQEEIMRPEEMLTFTDLRADSICWPFFGINGDESFFMFPAAYHGRAGILIFADGHAERHRWIDPRTYNPDRVAWHAHNHESILNMDLIYLQRHATEEFGQFRP